MPTATTEIRNFRLNEKILFDIILRQAGTLAKAILEGVMNAIDAGATMCCIEVKETEVIVSDDGKGIQKREHIEKWFEEFGAPHDEHEKKIFGTFRMGRGQLFAYGVNTWRTGPFKMDVDVKHKGLAYQLSKAEKIQGCSIVVKLYEPLLPSLLGETFRTVEKWCKYAPIHIKLNGKRISVEDITKLKWDHVLPEAYVKITDSNNLAIYNLGIHTMDVSGYRYGKGGVIVSRQQLKVNFARNDVQESCPVWKKVKPFFARAAQRNTRKAKKLTDQQVVSVIDQIRDGTLPPAAWEGHKIFTLVDGRKVNLHALCNYRYNYQITACQPGKVLGDTLMRRDIALVLSRETLAQFGVETIIGFAKLLRSRLDANEHFSFFRNWKPIPFNKLTEGMDRNYTIFKTEEHTPREVVWLDFINSARHKMMLSTEVSQDRRHYRTWANNRKVLIGQSAGAGWTDGQTHIVVCREFLKPLDYDLNGFFQVGSLLLHEMCHGESSANTHMHGVEFFQLFHDSHDALNQFVQTCLSKVTQTLERHNRKASKQALKTQDRLQQAARKPEVVGS